ncbi:hypothetical protein ACI65C_009182 [Semiaphis heraclei]
MMSSLPCSPNRTRFVAVRCGPRGVSGRVSPAVSVPRRVRRGRYRRRSLSGGGVVVVAVVVLLLLFLSYYSHHGGMTCYYYFSYILRTTRERPHDDDDPPGSIILLLLLLLLLLRIRTPLPLAQTTTANITKKSDETRALELRTTVIEEEKDK